MSTVIEVDGVSKRFGSIEVIDDLSFSLDEGEALGVVGPNGAGKTTTLNLVAGDIRPTRGTVRFDGHDITRLPAHKRCRLGIGRTSQVPRPFGGLTVYENVLVGASFGSAHGDGSAQDIAVSAMARTGMLDQANTLARELRLLDRKRLELSRALAVQPKVLLLDEIAGGLTDAEVAELITIISDIHASGVSIIWIEHIVHALLKVVDRMIAMDYGRLLVSGDPHAVMASDEVRNVYLGSDS